ncbi:MAG TPA: hypothetical protein DDZ51_03250 [Planctomycetaceae bacterium]|nr:hypothetical protein [Planctomycetaceae bacterium]
MPSIKVLLIPMDDRLEKICDARIAKTKSPFRDRYDNEPFFRFTCVHFTRPVVPKIRFYGFARFSYSHSVKHLRSKLVGGQLGGSPAVELWV